MPIREKWYTGWVSTLLPWLVTPIYGHFSVPVAVLTSYEGQFQVSISFARLSSSQITFARWTKAERTVCSFVGPYSDSACRYRSVYVDFLFKVPLEAISLLLQQDIQKRLNSEVITAALLVVPNRVSLKSNTPYLGLPGEKSCPVDQIPSLMSFYSARPGKLRNTTSDQANITSFYSFIIY